MKNVDKYGENSMQMDGVKNLTEIFSKYTVDLTKTAEMIYGVTDDRIDKNVKMGAYRGWSKGLEATKNSQNEEMVAFWREIK